MHKNLTPHLICHGETVRKMRSIMKKRNLCAVMVTAGLVAAILTGCGYDNSSNDLSKIDVDKYVLSIGEYDNLNIEVEPKEVITDEQVQQYIDYIMSSRVTYEQTDKKEVENGDRVNIDYVGTKDGVAFDGGTAQGYDLLIGSGTFIPGFEDGLIGHNVGEEVALNLTFPEQYQSAELAGQDVVFDVTINYISEEITPDLDDEFVKSLSLEGVSNVDEYRTFIRKDLEESAVDTYEAAKRDAAQEILVSQAQFGDITSLGLYQFYVDEVKKQTETLAKNYGVTIDDVVNSLYGSDYSKYEEQVAQDAENIVKAALVCEKIARKEKIKIGKKDLETRMAKDAEDYGYASVEEFKKQVPEADYRNYLIQSDVMDRVISTANITEKAAE